MSNPVPVDDIVFLKSVQNIFSDGADTVNRFRQADGARFTVHDDAGLLKIRGRREIWVGKANVAYIVPMTPERSKVLGPNPLEKAQEKGGGK